MEERNLTINELAETTRIRKEYLKKIEEGKAYGMQYEKHLLKIAKSLNTKLSVLLKF